MANYKGMICPVCHRVLSDDDDVVVCPICGAPHHRSCYISAGKCGNSDKHGTGEAYEDERSSKWESNFDGGPVTKCPRCGTENPADGLFCNICGSPLRAAKPGEDKSNPPHQMPYDPYMNPYGGVDPEEKIQGIPAKEIALFLGSNSSYFLPKFKDMSEGRHTASFNWSAFLLHGYYAAYRKIYVIAIPMLILSILGTIPSLLQMMTALSDMYQIPLKIADADAFFNLTYRIGMLFSFLLMAARVALAVFTNRIYMHHVIRSISRIRAMNLPEKEYYQKLTEKGGVGMKGVIIFLAVSMVSGFALAPILKYFILV